MEGILENLSARIEETDFSDLPVDVVREVKRHLLDVLGVMLAGHQTVVGQKIMGFVRGLKSPGESTIVGRGEKVSSFYAALVNASMGFHLELDDVHRTSQGPLLLSKHPTLFWGFIASMYLGNAILLVLNLPLISLWVRVVLIPYIYLFPLILAFCLIGAYSINNSVEDIYVMLIFSIVGYLMKKYEYEGAPLILAFILGPLLENALRQSLIMSHGEFGIFLEKPIALGALLVAACILLMAFLPWLKKKRPAIGIKE